MIVSAGSFGRATAGGQGLVGERGFKRRITKFKSGGSEKKLRKGGGPSLERLASAGVRYQTSKQTSRRNKTGPQRVVETIGAVTPTIAFRVHGKGSDRCE